MDTNFKNLLLPGVLIGTGAFLSALGFMGWMNNAAGIFLSLAENGLSWCF